MTRPTVKDLAIAAGVSVSTVNRVLHGNGIVRPPTQQRILHAAEKIDFYGLGPIRNAVDANQEVIKLGILLHQGGRRFYEKLAEALKIAAKAQTQTKVDLYIEFIDDLSTDNVANRLKDLSTRVDSISIVAAQHPLLAAAIDTVQKKGIPVLGLITPLSAGGNVGYIGLDYWKVGRTAAWAFDKVCRPKGKIGILVGNHRYRNQDLNESGFRSYFREHGTDFTLLEALSTFESAAVAREMTEKLFQDHSDLRGLFVSGGGITGALAAVREANRGEEFMVVGYELFTTTREALIDGTLTMALSHPLDKIAQETIAAMTSAWKSGVDAGVQNVILDFDIYTSENV